MTLLAPLLAGIGLFFCAMSMLEGNSLQEAWASTKQKFAPTLKANYLLWPAANLVNFAFVPPAQRILYCNVVYVSGLLAGCCWSCWLVQSNRGCSTFVTM